MTDQSKGTNMKNTLKQRLFALPLIALIFAMPLNAQDVTWSRYNFGLQVSALMPSGDTLKSVADTGVGLAGYIEKVWSSSWALRGRLEYTAFGEKEFGYGLKAKLSQTGAMLDTIYYMGHRNVLYPFAGIGYFSRSVDVKSGGTSGSVSIDSELAYCLGVGWNFTPHLGLELKYSQCESSWFQASVLFRF
jgi:hypothetical protein